MSISILCVYLVFGVQFAPAQAPVEMVRINAQKVDVDHENRMAHLSGNVSVGWGAFTLAAERVEIQYTESGTPKTWRAIGRVRVKWRSRLIESKTLFIEQSKERFVFNGPLVLVDGKQRLSATKATFFVNTQRFVIEQVSGQMNLKQLVKPK